MYMYNIHMYIYTCICVYTCQYTSIEESCFSLPQLRMQERLQERQGLLTKKEELAAVVQTNEREIKVPRDDQI